MGGEREKERERERKSERQGEREREGGEYIYSCEFNVIML